MSNQSNTKFKYEDLRHERDHMEGLLNQRFNFFMVIIGFILVAITFVENSTQLKLVFIVGCIIEFFIMLVIGRAQRRLDINIELLEKIPNNLHTYIRNEAKKGFRLNPFRFSMRQIAGYWIPIAITLVLLFSIFLSDKIFCSFQ